MTKVKLKLPKYVWLNGKKEGYKSAFRKVNQELENIHYQYWRDGGAWGFNVVERNGNLYSTGHSGDLNYLITLVTYKKWQR